MRGRVESSDRGARGGAVRFAPALPVLGRSHPVTRVLVLGADGMLGSMVCRVLSDVPEFDVVRCSRSASRRDLVFDANHDSVEELLDTAQCDWIINGIGILDCHIDESDPASVATAIHVNSTLPNRLAAAIAGRDSRLIHVTTDGVFSGRNAPYDEHATHDEVRIYGRSKSLGEPRSANCITLRCSIVGPETSPAHSLLGVVLSQPHGSVITGYTNHRWNGVTTLHLARVCAALIRGGHDDLPSLLHIVPGDEVSKAELIRLCLTAFGRNDLRVEDQPAPQPINRILTTRHSETNRRLWDAAGYAEPPAIADMVAELAATFHGQQAASGGPPRNLTGL
jgi:dTDP-4-dehydrorhamnose reductase